MPAAVAIPAIATVIAGGTAAAAGIYGSNRQSQAARDAANASERSTQEALALERENEARRREEWDKTQEFNEQVYREEVARDQSRYGDTRADAEWEKNRAGTLDAFDREKYNAYETRRKPYRDQSLKTLQAYAAKDLGLTITPSSMATLGK